MAAPASKTSPVAIELSSKILSVEMTEQNSETEADPLHIELSSVLSLEAKHTIITTLWDSSLTLVDYSDNEHQFSAYLTYYEHECQQISELLGKKHPTLQKASQDIQNLGVTLCLRLWLMINIRDPTDGNSVAGVRKIVWNEPVSVMSFIQETLAKNTESSRENPASCSSHEFNACNLDHMANIRIRFTANLVDHLIYDADIHRLLVFHFNSFLMAHLVPPNQNSACFPSSFQFYGTRLEALKEALSSAKKVSTKQLWFDRRSRQAWFTLWVAVVVFVLTVIFGILSSVTSVMQVDIALKTARAAGMQGL
ncbi:hypothetical protein BDD12DRAFT_810907 [Trichophaea hybrida]|nr:hypothetical protein BDD12DRAFT_810907 [Trichophaea hybrida]